MIYQTTALGRMVPESDAGTALQDLILKLLYDYRMSPFNAGNVPLKLSAIVEAARVETKLIHAIADSLTEGSTPLVEKQQFQGEDAYRITGNGVVFVQNAGSQRVASGT